VIFLYIVVVVVVVVRCTSLFLVDDGHTVLVTPVVIW